MIDVPCPHCGKRARSLYVHVKFECPVLNDRRSVDRPTDEEFWGMNPADFADIMSDA